MEVSELVATNRAGKGVFHKKIYNPSKDSNTSVYLLVLLPTQNGRPMDLFEKIDQFEKLANEIDVEEADDMQEAETVEDYLNRHLERRNAAKIRMNKLAREDKPSYEVVSGTINDIISQAQGLHRLVSREQLAGILTATRSLSHTIRTLEKEVNDLLYLEFPEE